MSSLTLVRWACCQAIEKAFQLKEEALCDVKLASSEAFGHYQCNSAMRLAKLIKKNPQEIAQQLIRHLKTTLAGQPFIEQVKVAGPGFINIELSPHFFVRQLQNYLRTPYPGRPSPLSKQRIIVEFSSPNVAKELHVAHLRSTIIGQALASLFEYLGHDVLRLNHIGDWGTPFGMLITYLKEHHELSLQDGMSLAQLQQSYKKARHLFETNEEFKKRAQLEVVRLQRKEPQTIALWQKICSISRQAFEQIYQLLQVEIQERGESFYEPYLPKIVKLLEEKKMITRSQGAKCLFMESFRDKEGKPLPLIVQKSDGGYNYATTDLAAMWQRAYQEKAERIIVVTDQGQALHFKMVAEAAQRAELICPNQRFDHVTFGLVLGKDGKKIKTRAGDNVRLIDLLQEAILAARKILEKKATLSQEKIEPTAHCLGINAVKYADLSTLRTKAYTFSFERMLRFEGNTAAFLLYSYVRCLSIQKKACLTTLPDLEKLQLSHPCEISLAYHLTQFTDILAQFASELYPHLLCDYLYILAEKFNLFFRDCRVIGSQWQDSRLLIVECVKKIFEIGFQILGLEKVDEM